MPKTAGYAFGSNPPYELDLACDVDACHDSRNLWREMMWASWLAAFGILIELIGFGTLAYELIQTNKSTILETLDLAAEKSDFGAIIVSEADEIGETSRSSIEGGIVGKLIDGIRTREDELRKRTALILRGVVISAIGCALQMVGSFAQALQASSP